MHGGNHLVAVAHCHPGGYVLLCWQPAVIVVVGEQNLLCSSRKGRPCLFGPWHPLKVWPHFFPSCVRRRQTYSKVVFIKEAITEETANNNIALSLYLDSLDEKRVYYWLNCPGGDVRLGKGEEGGGGRQMRKGGQTSRDSVVKRSQMHDFLVWVGSQKRMFLAALLPNEFDFTRCRPKHFPPVCPH